MRHKEAKYKAQPVYWNAKTRMVIHHCDIDIYRCDGKLKLPEHYWRFDSQHEFKVYLELIRMYGEGRILRQEPITIISPGWCYPRGKTWKVDFIVTDKKDRDEVDFLVEAKGFFLPEFGQALACLETESEYLFLKTKIVFPKKIPTRNQVVKALLKSNFAPNLMTLGDLKELKKLS